MLFLNQFKVYIIFCITIVTINDAEAVNYYFSSSTGNDANTGRSANTPWKNFAAKFPNLRSTLSNGDSILFKRGDTFVFGVNAIVNNNSAYAYPVVFSNYGPTNLPIPIITGGKIINPNTNSWQSVSSHPNIWFVAHNLDVVSNRPQFLMKNAISLPLGRTPNYNIADAGGKKLPALYNGSSNVFYQTGHFNNINWTGAELVHMPRTWIYARYPITYHNPAKDSLVILPTGQYPPAVGWGYYVQNHINTLDQEGEWACDSANIYLYSSTDPNNSLFTYPSANYAFDFGSSSSGINVVFRALKFIYYNRSAIRGSKSDSTSGIRNFKVLDCEFSYCRNGLELLGYSDIIVKNNVFSNMTNNGLSVSSIRALVESNKIKSISIQPGRCDVMNNNANGINLTGVNAICRFNIVDSVGFNAIRFEGQNNLIEKNILSNFTINKNDGGGIYSFNGFYSGPPTPYTGYKYGNNIIRNNIIYDGQANFTLASLSGISIVGGNRSTGVYSDNNSLNNQFSDNVIYNIKGNGMLFNAGALVDSITAINNLIFNVPYASAFNPYINDARTYFFFNNVAVESIPLRNQGTDNIYTARITEKGRANFNSYLRFDYNQDSTFLTQTSIRIPFNLRKNFKTDSSSVWIAAQPQLKKAIYGAELIKNGDFAAGLSTDWSITNFNLSATSVVASIPINAATSLNTNYLYVNTTGGSFTAVNHFFEISQNIILEQGGLYELNFNAYFDFSPCTTIPTPSKSDYPIEVRIGKKVYSAFSRTFSVYPTKTNFKIYIVPFSSGIWPLSIACTLPCKTKTYFDNFSLKKITNYSTAIEDYTHYKINTTNQPINHQLPQLNQGWYYLNPKNKSIVNGSVTINPFSGIFLIITNRTPRANQRIQGLIK